MDEIKQELAMFQLHQLKRNNEMTNLIKELEGNVNSAFGENKGSWNKIWSFADGLSKRLESLESVLDKEAAWSESIVNRLDDSEQRIKILEGLAIKTQEKEPKSLWNLFK